MALRYGEGSFASLEGAHNASAEVRVVPAQIDSEGRIQSLPQVSRTDDCEALWTGRNSSFIPGGVHRNRDVVVPACAVNGFAYSPAFIDSASVILVPSSFAVRIASDRRSACTCRLLEERDHVFARMPKIEAVKLPRPFR